MNGNRGETKITLLSCADGRGIQPVKLHVKVTVASHVAIFRGYCPRLLKAPSYPRKNPLRTALCTDTWGRSSFGSRDEHPRTNRAFLDGTSSHRQSPRCRRLIHRGNRVEGHVGIASV
jgi:hypothetical protein